MNYSIIAAMNRAKVLQTLSLVLVLSCLSQPLTALQVTGLYSDRVAVANDGDGERRRAFREALAAVILKVTGERRWLEHPAVRQALDNAQRYVQATSFSSETVPVAPAPVTELDDALDAAAAAAAGPDAPVAPPQPSTREQRYITVQFAESLVERMLADAGIPVWNSNRPSVLVWMVLQNAAGERTMLSVDSNPEIINLMREFAGERGLPIIFPLLDFEDRRSVSTDQVWALEEEAIAQASQRYGADSVLAARLHFTASGELVGLWQFIFQNQVQVFDGFATELRDYLFEPLDRITAQLASYFAITPDSANRQTVDLRIDGVDNLKAYADLLNYIGSLGLVQNVTPTEVNGTRLALRLAVMGNAQRLHEVIALNRNLLPVSDSVEESGQALHYRWTR